MSFCLRPNVCKKCGKPLTLFEGWKCLECDKAEQEPKTEHWIGFTHSVYHGVDEDGEPIWRKVTVYHCDKCNRRTVVKEKYCPNCGAKMEDKA